MSSDIFILMKSELSLTLIICIILLLKVWDGIQKNTFWLYLVTVLLGLHCFVGLIPHNDGVLFNGMFYTNTLIVFEKTLLSVATFIILLQTFDWLNNHSHVPEFYILLLTTLLGMNLMISSGNFLMFYLGLELSAIPLAALSNFDLEKLSSSEAATKNILLSAFASSIMLFGISLLYGITGTITFAELPVFIVPAPLPIIALLFIFTGFAFKLSIAPFHLWTADVYEGSPVAITAYLSVVSKAASVFVFISVLSALFFQLRDIWYNVLFVSIIITISVGNLFALRQNNIKRFFAFSSVAQVGYIVLGISANNQVGTAAVIFFILVYMFSNLGAFCVIAIVSALAQKEDINDYRGFYQHNKLLSWAFALSVFSLAGIPPTAGFFGKIFLITAGASRGNMVLVSIASLQMVVSLYYYLRIIKIMIVDTNDEPIAPLQPHLMTKIGLGICMIGIIITGFVGTIYDYIYHLIV